MIRCATVEKATDKANTPRDQLDFQPDPSTITLQIEIDPSDPDGMYHYHYEETSLSVVRCNDPPLRMSTTSQGALLCNSKATAECTPCNKANVCFHSSPVVGQLSAAPSSPVQLRQTGTAAAALVSPPWYSLAISFFVGAQGRQTFLLNSTCSAP